MITLILPEGLSPERYHALAQRLVGKLGGSTLARAAESKGSRSFVLLSEIEGASPEMAAVLNDSTWTLTLPVSANLGADKLTASAQSVAGGREVHVEIPPNYRAE
ncbi:hypothetical protein BMJ34_04155 [Sinorhizobium medicae]|uniref:Uncharacterized protein n=1 Tax=Sinorhizobium medicae TaxID=110321 RepID=A0ABX4TWS3_9HYPH|nr:hypothetical protein [Sinorhizobium medicae]PLU07696.1 hypothetical protein BMJ34_04155 [Sinorhizobium medicae]PLU09479.1 hypothetical protein BMJ33_00735 [Sinorhizobium medicae]PLU24423.1 hypothetical protein BMJ29_02425 [Sinorhizobium medicae]PLU37237.1 hypothetical protein BMJ27_08450 [Sinorhizobium medicae]